LNPVPRFGARARRKVSKRFFFDKKKQKTFFNLGHGRFAHPVIARLDRAIHALASQIAWIRHVVKTTRHCERAKRKRSNPEPNHQASETMATMLIGAIVSKARKSDCGSPRRASARLAMTAVLSIELPVRYQQLGNGGSFNDQSFLALTASTALACAFLLRGDPLYPSPGIRVIELTANA
jgi:hypothetical protein